MNHSPQVIEADQNKILDLTGKLRRRRDLGETASEKMKQEMADLQQPLKNAFVDPQLQTYGYFTLAVHDPDNAEFAAEFAKRVDEKTPRHLIAEAYGLGRKRSYQTVGKWQPIDPDSKKAEKPVAKLLELSVEQQTPLQRSAEAVVKKALSNLYYAQHTAGGFIGDLSLQAQKHRVPVADEKIREFEEINNTAQVARAPWLKTMFGDNAVHVISGIDKMLGATSPRYGCSKNPSARRHGQLQT